MQDNNNRWHPTMDDYYASIGYNLNIDTSNLKDLVAFLCTKFKIPPLVAQIFVQVFFRELATLMLRGSLISFANFGKFFVNSPKTTNKIKTLFYFRPVQKFKRKLNGK